MSNKFTIYCGISKCSLINWFLSIFSLILHSIEDRYKNTFANSLEKIFNNEIFVYNQFVVMANNVVCVKIVYFKNTAWYIKVIFPQFYSTYKMNASKLYPSTKYNAINDIFWALRIKFVIERSMWQNIDPGLNPKYCKVNECWLKALKNEIRYSLFWKHAE